MTRMPNSEAFWSFAEARAREAEHIRWREAKRRALNVPNADRRSGPRWRSGMRKPRRPRHTGGWISIGPEMSKLTGDLMDAVAPKLMKAFDDHLPPVARVALERWPTSSGLSAATVDLNYYTTGPGEFVGSILVRAPYAAVIKGGPGHKLIWGKTNMLAQAISAQAADDLAKVA